MLGQKMKRVRREKGLSLDDLARKSGFSKSFLSQIENGKNSPSIPSLKRITDALEVSVGALFEEEHDERVLLLRKSDRTPFEAAQEGVTFEFCCSKVPKRKMEALFFTLHPGGAADEAHAHEGEEFGTVLEGTLLVELGGTEYRMQAGDTIYFSSSIPHRWKNPTSDVIRALWVVSPPLFLKVPG